MSGEGPVDLGVEAAAGRVIRVPVVRVPGSEDLPLPAYQTDGSAGVDLHAALTEPLTLRQGEIHLVPCGIRMAVPPGWEAQIRPRSGWALRSGLTLVNTPGTIDSDYRGEIRLVVTCLKNEPCTIRRGDRIAQAVFAPVGRARIEAVPELDETSRAQGGFGHTG